MDILIKDFSDKMPQTCYECPFAVAHITTLLTSSFGRGSYCCILTHKTITSTRRNRFCPLVEINGERKDDASHPFADDVMMGEWKDDD